VQLREFFGDAVGERLRSSVATPVLERSQTILIEEVANLAPAMQLRILSALAGAERFWVFDTSRNLEAMVAAGQFDPGLGQRIGQNRIVLPPLRQQRDSLRSEAERFLRKLVGRNMRQIQFSQAALDGIASYDWPGNLQEFYETIEAAYFLTRTERIEPEDLHFGLWYRSEEDALNLRRRTEELERKLILQAHAIHGGNQVHMARALGISRGSLQYRWARLGLQEETR
jgi:sigma-54-dependent transcriptional regulator